MSKDQFMKNTTETPTITSEPQAKVSQSEAKVPKSRERYIKEIARGSFDAMMQGIAVRNRGTLTWKQVISVGYVAARLARPLKLELQDHSRFSEDVARQVRLIAEAEKVPNHIIGRYLEEYATNMKESMDKQVEAEKQSAERKEKIKQWHAEQKVLEKRTSAIMEKYRGKEDKSL